MTANYRFTATAQRTLDHEIAYSKEKWGAAHAQRYFSELMACIRTLADHPHLHPERPELGKGMRCVRFKGNFIVYRPCKDNAGIVITNLPSVYVKKLI